MRSQLSYLRRSCLECVRTYLGHYLNPSSLSLAVVEETADKIGSGVGLITQIGEVVEERRTCRCESSEHEKNDKGLHIVVDDTGHSVVGLCEDSKEDCSSVARDTPYIVQGS
jgi:hypothetical protein